MITEAWREWIGEQNPEALFADGYEDAIMGYAQQGTKQPLVVYDAEKCIEILMNRDGMDREEAQEFFEFNTLGSWMGEGTPLFFYPTEE